MFSLCVLGFLILVISEDLYKFGKCQWHQFGDEVGLILFAVGVFSLCQRAGAYGYGATIEWISGLIKDAGEPEFLGVYFVIVVLFKVSWAIFPAIKKIANLDEDNGPLKRILGGVGDALEATCDSKGEVSDEELETFVTSCATAAVLAHRVCASWVAAALK